MSDNRGDKYLYCLIETRRDKRYTGAGVEGSCPIYAVRFRDVAAVVSDISQDVIKATTEDCLLHEMVIEKAMKEQAVLPFEFGTISPSKEAVLDLLKDNYSNIKRSLKNLHDKQEMNVRAVWSNMNEIFREIVSENRDIAFYKKEIEKKTPRKTYDDKIKIGQMVAQALHVKREKERDSIVNELKREAAGCVPGRITGDNMILNEAFLVRRKNLKRFESKLYSLGNKLNGRIGFKYTGPLPPYSFTNLKLKIRS